MGKTPSGYLNRYGLCFAGLILFSFLVGWVPKGNPNAIQRRPTKASDSEFEATQTEKLLGVPVKNFPAPQGLTGFDELPINAPAFKFKLTGRPLSGPPPRVSFETRPIVEARAPDGSMYEAYCGRDDVAEITPGHGFVSNFENTRQRYDTHYGYGYQPENVYIGKREAGRITPTLFFRDVGSHTTAPHYLAIDSESLAHLVVADVNISQNNRLDLYWVIGDPRSGKWKAAWLIDRRGFTSWSHPWSGAWANKVHVVWDWCDVSVNKRAPGMGAFHAEWSPNGFSRRVRVISGPVEQFSAAIDSESGRLMIVLAKNNGVYVVSRSADGVWTRPVLLHPSLRQRNDISVQESKGGAFIIRTCSETFIRTSSETTKEWILIPQRT
ncbi:MAG: hypothetical protein ND895_02975 [Pyrinomonadaceae bacterium]|nr:hypothetical protein [Pyrinomonadaceae bacterium]